VQIHDQLDLYSQINEPYQIGALETIR